jgi:hypothetical protein
MREKNRRRNRYKIRVTSEFPAPYILWLNSPTRVYIPLSFEAYSSHRIIHTNLVWLLPSNDQLVAHTTTYITHKKRTCMPSAEFEPMTPAFKRLKTARQPGFPSPPLPVLFHTFRHTFRGVVKADSSKIARSVNCNTPEFISKSKHNANSYNPVLSFRFTTQRNWSQNNLLPWN